MKILIIQEKGRHLKNENFREGLNMKRALERIGHDTIVWGLNYENFSTPFEEISKDCDAILLFENYEIGSWLPNLAASNKLKLFWSIDSHCVLSAHVSNAASHKIDIVLNAIESHMPSFNRKAYYFPNCYPHDLMYPIPEIEKTHNIGFIGGDGTGPRVNTINYLKQKWGMRRPGFVIGDDMVREVNSYKIHFNMNIANDVNYRTFETPGMKTLLLTNKTENVQKLFEIGKHIEMYTSQGELDEKVKYYLDNPDKRKEIEEAGYKHVLENHTFDCRAKQLIEIIEENI